MELADLLSRVKTYLPEEKIDIVREAYAFAQRAHEGQRRRSGEPFFEHPCRTAYELASLQADLPTLAAALLHDVVEDSHISLAELESTFGAEVARLVDGVTKLSQVELHKLRENGGWDDRATLQAESLRKMLVAMARDIRVVLIKLADRLHNMRTLRALPPSDRLRISRETLDIYAPLAHRLGIWQIEWQLEDLAFRYLQPEEYRRVNRLLASHRPKQERYITQVTRVVCEELERAGIQAEVSGRPKHLYSIYEKMERYEALGRQFSDIYDLLALRVIVDTVQDCYHAVGVVHALWRPLPGLFDDYIASPRENMYQSLHSTVMALDNRPLEVQIRTHEMHHLAEYGVAAHWRYKDGTSVDMRFEERISWLRQLLEWQREVSGAEEFIESAKSDLLPDQVFLYTPRGEIKELPVGAGPLDFAFRIHTDLGYQCIGAKVNGRIVPLTYQLKNGDTVDILTSKRSNGPSLDWLNPDVGYVHTANARAKIRVWFRRRDREEHLQRGRQVLERESKRLGIPMDPQEIAVLFKYDSTEDLLVALGSGNLGIHQVSSRLIPQEERPRGPGERARPRKSSEIKVLGVGDVATKLARCCEPLPGDEIVGFITRGRGVTVHRVDCPSVVNEDEPERLVAVAWERAPGLYPVDVSVEAWDRVGLLRDLTAVVSGEKVNISGISDRHREDGTVTISMIMQTTGLAQLSRLFSKLDGVRGVTDVARSAPGVRSP